MAKRLEKVRTYGEIVDDKRAQEKEVRAEWVKGFGCGRRKAKGADRGSGGYDKWTATMLHVLVPEYSHWRVGWYRAVEVYLERVGL